MNPALHRYIPSAQEAAEAYNVRQFAERLIEQLPDTLLAAAKVGVPLEWLVSRDEANGGNFLTIRATEKIGIQRDAQGRIIRVRRFNQETIREAAVFESEVECE